MDEFDYAAERTSSLRMRAFLCNVGKGWYIEATGEEEDKYVQTGYVDKVIRDRYGLPACLRVKCGEKNGRTQYDYIAPERVSYYEGTDYYIEDLETLETYKTFEELDATFKSFGYTEYDEEEGCWRNPDTGEEACF